MSWTDERVALLKKFWNEGFSATQIAAQLGGVTRNAVIGKLFRLNLAGRTAPHARAIVRRPKATASGAPRTMRPKQARPHPGNIRMKKAAREAEALKPDLKLPPEPPKPPDCAPVRFLDLTGIWEAPGQCRWPVEGEPGPEMLCCGAAKPLGQPYCRWHAKIGAGWRPSDAAAEKLQKLANTA